MTAVGDQMISHHLLVLQGDITLDLIYLFIYFPSPI